MAILALAEVRPSIAPVAEVPAAARFLITMRIASPISFSSFQKRGKKRVQMRLIPKDAGGPALAERR